MKNAIYFAIVAVCVGLIIFGLMRKDDSQNNQIAVTAEQTATAEPQTASSAPAAIGQNVEHFRPDTASVAESGSSSTEAEIAERNFQLTPDLIAKMYLVDAYKPGICYGAPLAIPQVAIEGMIANNPTLSEYLKKKYNLKTDLEIYNKIKQMNGISLTETASSKFNFTFMDGQCQNVTYYEGVVTVSGSSISAIVTNQTSHTYQ